MERNQKIWYTDFIESIQESCKMEGENRLAAFLILMTVILQ